MMTQNSDSRPGENAHNRLANGIAQWTTGRNFYETPIKGLRFSRFEAPTDPTSYLLGPSICLIGQGRKQSIVGDATYVYDANHYLVSSVNVPVVANIIEASAKQPYLGLIMALDLQVVAKLMLQDEMAPPGQSETGAGIAVSRLSAPLTDAFVRLIELLDHPNDIAALSPLIQQEIIYRLLQGEQGARLRQMVTTDSPGHRIARAIDWIKENFDKPLRLDDLAERAGLSNSAFHNRFRIVTNMSPLQFQKRMRLSEARRLMLTEHLDAAQAAYEVGYESPSQFSREYSRMFGAPPLRDIKKLNQAAQTAI